MADSHFSKQIKKRISLKTCAIPFIIGLLLERGNIHTNERGLALIGDAEGCYREAYYCPAGRLTDGIGNTLNVNLNIIKNNENIAKDWEKNILDAEFCVNRYANGKALPENVFSAAVEITFNVGCNKIKNSVFYDLLKKGELNSACDELPRWIYMNGKIMKGLINRRNQSKALCKEGLE